MCVLLTGIALGLLSIGLGIRTPDNASGFLLLQTLVLFSLCS